MELLELKAPVPRGRPRKRTEIEENDNGEPTPYLVIVLGKGGVLEKSNEEPMPTIHLLIYETRPITSYTVLYAFAIPIILITLIYLFI